MIIQVALLVVAPIVYLVVANVVLQGTEINTQPGNDLLYYILIALSMVHPLAYLVIERIQVAMYRKSEMSQMSPEQLMSTLLIIRSALVEAIYIFGLVNVFATHDFSRILIFYAIGIVWTVIYWPTKERRQKILDKIGTRP